VKWAEPGTVVMMPLQPQLIVLQQPDGLYPMLINSRIQDIVAELIGIRTPPLSTGVVHRPFATTHCLCASLLVVPSATLRRLLAVSVPSGV